MRNGSIGRNRSFPQAIAIATLAVALLPVVASATPLLGCSFGDSGRQPLFFDIDPATGQTSNPRPTVYNVAGLTLTPDGTLYGFAIISSGSLYRFDPTTGTGTFVGGAGLYNPFEGDLDYDAASGELYGLVNAPDAPTAVRQLFTVDRHTGAATVVGPIPGVADPSAMAFAPDGTLYVLDTFYQRLLTVNKADASVSKYVPLSKPLGPVAGMDFDPASGVLYVGDGDGTSNSLYSLNTTTGTLSLIGPLAGSPAGISALTFVPEPAGVLALFAVPLLSRGRRRGR